MLYILNNLHKFIFVAILIAGYSLATQHIALNDQNVKTEQAMGQLKSDFLQQKLTQEHWLNNNMYFLGWCLIFLVCFLVFFNDLKRLFSKPATVIVILLVFSVGCYRPFEPVKLETIQSNEEAFLLPLTGDGKKQTSSDNEEYLKENLVYTKQVKIPQQWVTKGFETFGANGEWRDAAILIKVDKSPVTREWTADPMSGTSNKNEAVWVMTSDQVEFSTGWTITARISNREDAIKFLHNYPNGSLKTVLDSEVRSKLQAEFGLEVTDLPMDTLRKQATPHIIKTVKNVTDFFKLRGITVTNLGITGGFVYKDKTILETMVKVFNAEQEKAIAAAGTNAQRERNQAVILKAQGEADALMKTRKAEADGIKLVAEARNFEFEKAKADLPFYVALKQMELQTKLVDKWNGSYPTYFMGGNNPNTLLQLPNVPFSPKSK